MPKLKNVYMHTYAGRPALFDGRYVTVAGNGQRLQSCLRSDLATIRREQAMSQRNDGGLHLEHYGYIRYTVPA